MGISPTQLLIVLAIIALLFGTKKLRGIGGDLGTAIKGFKKAVTEEEKIALESAGEQAEQQKPELANTSADSVVSGSQTF